MPGLGAVDPNLGALDPVLIVHRVAATWGSRFGLPRRDLTPYPSPN